MIIISILQKGAAERRLQLLSIVNLDTLDTTFSVYFPVCLRVRLGAAGETAGGCVTGSPGPGGLIQTC